MSDALKRRCLHLFIDFPDEALETKILETKVPGIDVRLAEELVGVMARLRKLDLKKTPSISETLDWARALLALNAAQLDEGLVRDTLNVILKYEADIKKAQSELGRLITRKADAPAAQAAGAAAPAQPALPQAATAKKGVLH
jgi:MoxR-like ATPase